MRWIVRIIFWHFITVLYQSPVLNSDHFTFCMKNHKTHHLTIKKHQFTMTNHHFRRVFSPGSSPSPAASPRTSGSSPRHRCPGGWPGGRAASGAEKRRPGHSAAYLTRSTCGELWVFVMFSSKSQQEVAENSPFTGIFWGEMIKNLDIWLIWPLNNVEIPWNPLV